jgi:hypothetical protein
MAHELCVGRHEIGHSGGVFLISHAVSSLLECSNKLVLLLVHWVFPLFFVFIFVLENKREQAPV